MLPFRPKKPRKLGLRAVFVALTLVVGCGGEERTRLERARDLVEDNGGFGTALESGETFAHVGELLLETGRECTSPCPAVLQASAYVQLVAVGVLECTQPGIHDARRAVLDHLDDVIASPSSTELEPPALPAC